MRDIKDLRSGRPGFYPDQAIYAEFACAEAGLTFRELDDGTGLLFSVASAGRQVRFGAGRCSYYPQNNATASTMASDKYFTNRVLEAAGTATLGGDYFFLHERHRALRPAGHEREDAFSYLRQLGGSGFAKPLIGSRGDFAQFIENETALCHYLDAVSRHYDSILLQGLCSGIEYRIFLLDEEAVYAARKYPPQLTGDGVHSVRDLLTAHNERLRSRGLSPVAIPADEAALASIPKKDERCDVPGRMNLSAGGRLVLAPPPSEAAVDIARSALRALGLRVAAVDLFTQISGEAEAFRVIEVNSNPSIRLLEESDRADLILKIWRHTFSAMGLLDGQSV
jgi:hypothetical protein